MLNKEKKILYIVIIIILLLFGWREISNRLALDRASDSYSSIVSFKDIEISSLIRDKNLKSNEVIILKQNVVSEKAAKKVLEGKVKNYKRIQSFVATEAVTRVEGLVIELTPKDKGKPEDSTSIDLKEKIEKNYVKIPSAFTYSDEWISIDGTVRKDLTLDSLTFINKFDVLLGYKKPEGKKFKFLRKPEPYLELTSYNPYTKVNYVNNLVVEDDKKKVEKIMFSKLAIFIYGLLGGKLLLK